VQRVANQKKIKQVVMPRRMPLLPREHMPQNFFEEPFYQFLWILPFL